MTSSVWTSSSPATASILTSAATHVFGEPSADLLARHRRVLETQEMVADAIRPGEPIRVAFEKCPAGWTIEAHRVGIEIHMDPMFSSVKTDNKLDVIVPVGYRDVR